MFKKKTIGHLFRYNINSNVIEIINLPIN